MSNSYATRKWGKKYTHIETGLGTVSATGSQRLKKKKTTSTITKVWDNQEIIQFTYLVVSSPLQPHGLQHARLSSPSPTPWADSNSCPSSRWYHPTISSSVVPFSSCPQSFRETERNGIHIQSAEEKTKNCCQKSSTQKSSPSEL